MIPQQQKEIVRRGYDKLSYAYRRDDTPDDCEDYAAWARILADRLPDRLPESLDGLLVHANAPLAPLTSLGVGGPAPWIIELARTDYRDLIVWAEYDNAFGDRKRDLTRPFSR